MRFLQKIKFYFLATKFVNKKSFMLSEAIAILQLAQKVYGDEVELESLPKFLQARFKALMTAVERKTMLEEVWGKKSSQGKLIL